MPSPAAPPATTAEAIASVTTGLAYLARTDATALGAAGQADCLRALAAAEAVHTAARVNILAAFSTSQGYHDDGCGSERSWLVWQTQVTRAAAGAAVGWVRRLRGHRPVWEALAGGAISPSWARQICEWTGRLPEDSRDDADAILLAAATGGADLAGLGALAYEMHLRSCPADEDHGQFEDRGLFLAQTFGQAGRLEADLTPAASAALRAVLDSLGAKAGPEDTRSKPQREHDGLEEACLRLIASGMLPQRAGQPIHLQLQITLDQLRAMHGASGAEAAWAAQATSSGLTSAEAQALACDATIFPLVTGTVNQTALDSLIQLIQGGHTHSRFPAPTRTHPHSTPGTAGAHQTTGPGTHGTPGTAGTHGAAGPPGGTDCTDVLDGPDPAAAIAGRVAGPAVWAAERRLRQTVLAMAAQVLSGPGGLAALLRRSLDDGPWTTVSLPLDVGTASETIPGHLRRAVILRDRHCQFPGCWQPPSVCQVHHLIHREDGGPTSLQNCCLLCRFHHLTVIHRWGWKLTAHPDGTTTATSPTGHTLHSHSPPSQAA